MNNELKDLILSSSSITGSTVNSLRDEKIGTIKDLMMDTETGKVAYVVLSVDSGFLNMSSKYFAIPWQAFTFNSKREDVLSLDIDKDRLENSPGFDKDNWPKGPQNEFISEVNAFYEIDSNRGVKGEPASNTSGNGSSSLDRNRKSEKSF